MPALHQTNNATNLKLYVVSKLNKLFEAKSVFTTPYNPKSNGTKESTNESLVKII